MKCINPECSSEKVFSRGYCSSCYHRLRKRGTLQRAYVINKGVCSVEGCGEKSFAKNLCDKHYYEADDPLKQPWKNLRSRYPGEFPPSWDKFEAFLADAPPKPATGDYQLRRIRRDEPWSSTNMEWLSISPGIPRYPGEREYQSQYNKVWTDQRKYGVSKERREEMLKAQDGKCAICKKPEGMRNPRHPEREPRRLSIDHDHRTGATRGLLCGRCNTMIGKRAADDNIEVLESAIAYLKSHKH